MSKSLEKKVERSGLHDSGLDGIEYNNGHLRMKFSDVNINRHSDEVFEVIINMIVTQIKRNGELVDSIYLEAPGSSVLNFERSETKAELLLEWINYITRENIFCKYEFEYNAFDLQVFPQEEEP